MSQRLYDASTAEALMKFAYPEYGEHDLKPYEIREDGVYAVDTFRHLCPPGTIYDWTPADEMEWPGSPNPDTAPFLPIPFNAAQLAAAMIDGPGQSIVHAMGRRLGYPLDIDALNRFPDRMRWMREALAEAYAVAAAAQSVVGEFDHDQEERAHEMAQQYEKANEQANEREGVFQQGITSDEARTRRARAVEAVADLKAHVKGEQAAIADEWKAWRKAMVRQLLEWMVVPMKAATERDEVAWFDTTLDAAGFFALEHVPPVQAAMLLCQISPHDSTESEAENCTTDCTSPDDFKRLRLTFVSIDQNRPAHRSLLDWMAIAASAGRAVHPWAQRYAKFRGLCKPSESPALVAVESASSAPSVPFKKAALIAAHVHEWPTIERDIADATANGLASAAKAAKRGWREADALNWARAKGKLISAAKPADSLAQAMHNLGALPSRKHTMQG